MKSYATVGFQASHLAQAVHEVNRMVHAWCVWFAGVGCAPLTMPVVVTDKPHTTICWTHKLMGYE